jgi:hypothetical protein
MDAMGRWFFFFLSASFLVSKNLTSPFSTG